MDAIRKAPASNSSSGALSKVQRKFRNAWGWVKRRWDASSANERYVVYGGSAFFLLFFTVVVRWIRRRRLRREGDAMVAMIAPSAEFGHDDGNPDIEDYDDDDDDYDYDEVGSTSSRRR